MRSFGHTLRRLRAVLTLGAALGAALALVVACDTAARPDGAADARSDATGDAGEWPDGQDGGVADATPDAVYDAVHDAVHDAVNDAGEDAAPADAADPDAAEPDATGDAAGPDAAPDTGGDPAPRYLTRLASPADFAAVALEGEVKYLARVEGRTPPPPLEADCYFQDMHQAEWHLQFLHGFPELAGITMDEYVQWVMHPTERRLWGGALVSFPAVRHPLSGATGVFVYTVYTAHDVAQPITVDDLTAVHTRLAQCAPFAADLLVWVPENPTQKQFAQAAGATLTERGVAWLLPEQLVSGLPFVAYSEGEGYGTLRVVPRGAELVEGSYGPRDVVVVESAPNDIAVVAGLVAADPQNLHSHVNLRLSEKGIPNASVPGIYENAWVQALDGLLVHLVVRADAVTIEAARIEDAEAFWEANRPDIGTVRSDLTVRALTSFAHLGHADAVAFGAKAANLGELYAALPAPHRVEGFGVPFAWYADYVAENGLDDAIAALAADPRMESDRNYRADTLDSLRRRLKRGRLPAGFETELHARLRAAFGATAETTRIRFRSSTNAEDLTAFSGAGLYDSRSGCLADDLDGDEVGPSHCLGATEKAHVEAQLATFQAEYAAHPERAWLVDLIEEAQEDLTEEKPVANAVRKVWASLWNDRAWEERAYYGIDHTAVYMGLAVEAAFVLEQVNAVAVTNLGGGGDAGDPLYRVVSQRGEWSVVRPEDPTLIAEVVTFRRSGDPPAPTDVRVLVPSSLVAEGETVWSEADLATLAGLLFTAQDHFAAAVYPELDPLRLDIEVKLTRDGVVQLKQARPYLGLDAP